MSDEPDEKEENKKIEPLYHKDCEGLFFKRLRIPRLIPIALIENVKERTFTAEEFYDYQEEQIDNPFNLLFAIVDIDSKIHGYLWGELSAFDKSIFINTFSISKRYWGKGMAMPLIREFLLVLIQAVGAPRLFWITTNEKFFNKHGFKKSKHVLMEFKMEYKKSD
jgi:N-acetylglutamate synthase-like GNAT family acetyltransferase